MASGWDMPNEDGRRWLECQICLSSMVGRKPRGLNCLHTFCESCLEGLPLEASSITCPTCRRQTKLLVDGIPGLPINFMIEQLATKLHQANLCQTCVENEGASHQAVVYCNDGCGRLCSDCRKRHDSVENFKEHQVDPLKKEDEKGIKHCLTHNKRIHLFCTECNTCLCSTCAVSSKHQGHESCIKEIRNVYQRLCSNLKGRIKAIQDLCKEKMLEIRMQEDTLKKTSQEIETEYMWRRQKLEDERAKLLDKLKQGFSSLTDVQTQLEKLCEDTERIEEGTELEEVEKFPRQKMSEIILHMEKCAKLQKETQGVKTALVTDYRFAVASTCDTELGELVPFQAVRVGSKVKFRDDIRLTLLESVLSFGHMISGYVTDINGDKCTVDFDGISHANIFIQRLEVVSN